ncbi:MAG: monofunctional biosynthetic peptidoglycan transglycosylase [Vicinamibacterales bacterium]
MIRAGWWMRAVLAAAFWSGVYVYATLPDVRPLVRENPRTTAFMEMRAAEDRAHVQPSKRDWRWVPYGRISDQLRRAVLVAEDAAFWQHEGIDFEQIRESMEVNLERMEFARGASTITQQLAKNLYLSPSRNPVRKVREWLITRRLEAVLSKRRILELYLNVIEWGDGVWGAEAAARSYFRKPAAAVGPAEAALLAGAIINPRIFNPLRPNARLLRRQRLVLRRMGGAAPPPDTAPPRAAESAPPDRPPAEPIAPASPERVEGVEELPNVAPPEIAEPTPPPDQIQETTGPSI